MKLYTILKKINKIKQIKNNIHWINFCLLILYILYINEKVREFKRSVIFIRIKYKNLINKYKDLNYKYNCVLKILDKYKIENNRITIS